MEIFRICTAIVYISQLATCGEVSHDVKNVRFLLFPSYRNNNSEEIVFNDTSSLRASSFQPNAQTVFVVHGFGVKYAITLIIKDALLSKRVASNVIIVNWELLGSPKESSRAPLSVVYLEAVSNTKPIGQRIANFIKFLVNQNVLSLDLVYIVGHSMGAHISGEAGRTIQHMYRGSMLQRITGLDPVGPLFHPAYKTRALCKTDASFVDIIHTDAGTVGDITEDGDADFYPNGGGKQPNCDDSSIGDGVPGFCSHLYSISIYAASIYRPYIACQCTLPVINLNPATGKTCTGRCENPTYLGALCPTTARGMFLVNATNPP